MHMDDASEASPALCSQLNKTVPSHHFSSTVPVEWASADQPMPVTHTAEKLFESKAYFSTSLVGKVRGIFNHLVKTTDIYLGRKYIFIVSFLPSRKATQFCSFSPQRRERVLVVLPVPWCAAPFHTTSALELFANK